MRLAAYAGASAALAAGTLIKAFAQRPNFYSATVYLSQSNACMLILTNLALVCTISFIYGMQRLCYGKLRPVEIEQLSEKAWYAVLDTLLAMPSLRDDVGGWLLVVFVLLLAGKVWGWIAEGRVDTFEQQPPADPRMFHIRLTASIVISMLFDAIMCNFCLQSVLANPRPGMMVIFTFEFAIQTVFAVFTACRYVLAVQEAKIVAAQTKQKMDERKEEIRQERLEAIRAAGQEESTLVEPTDDDVDENEIDVPGWEEKRRHLFVLELATDCVKILLYTVFFAISVTFIGLPMHIMRDVYITIASFSKRIQDYSNYRRATQDMNNRYPDATAEELGRENTCIVCRDAMIPWNQPLPEHQPGQPRPRQMNEGLRAKKLPCGHVLHLRCLKAWLERQQACPTCRRSVLPPASAMRDAQGNVRPAAELFAEAQRANAAAGQPGQPGQPGAAALPGQPGQPNAAGAAAAARQLPPRQNRMRWLNMGPVRLGFYNGPAGDVQDALRQRQAGAVAQPGHAEAVRNSRGTPRCERHLSTEDHLRTVELRLMQQAHNLDVDRAQLTQIRAMEAEMTRLRSLRISSRTTPSSSSTINTTPTATGTIGMAPILPVQPSAVPFQRYQAPAATAPLTNGNTELPNGLILPDGWTMVPLQRVQQGAIQPIPVPMPMQMPPGLPLPMMPFPQGPPMGLPDLNMLQPPAAQSSGDQPASQPVGAQATTDRSNTAAAAPTTSTTAPPQADSSATGADTFLGARTDSQPADTPDAANVTQAGPSTTANEAAKSADAQPSPTLTRPSVHSEPTWGFSAAEPSTTQSGTPTAADASASASNDGPGLAAANTTTSRQAEVEDVPDEGLN